MLKQPLRMIVNATNSFIAANPVERNNTWGIDQTVAPKRAGSRSVTNSRTTFTSRSIVAVPALPGSAEVSSTDTEVIQVKTSISGSVENSVQVNKAVLDHLENLKLSYPDAVIGFINRTAEYAVNHVVG